MAADEDEEVVQGVGDGWWGQATEGAGFPLLWTSGDHLLPRPPGPGVRADFPRSPEPAPGAARERWASHEAYNPVWAQDCSDLRQN